MNEPDDEEAAELLDAFIARRDELVRALLGHEDDDSQHDEE